MELNKVIAVFECVKYEGCFLKGVFSSTEKANKFAKTIKVDSKYGERILIKEYEIDNPTPEK